SSDLGSNKFVDHQGVDDKAVYLSVDEKVVAKISIEDEIKDNSSETISYLQSKISQLAIVSGDNEKSVKETADKLGIKEYYAGLMPDQKLEILKSYDQKNKTTIFVGDGINDAPVLKQANVGISMGDTASDIAIESSDILVANGEFSQMKKLMEIAKITVQTVKQNVTF